MEGEEGESGIKVARRRCAKALPRELSRGRARYARVPSGEAAKVELSFAHRALTDDAASAS